MVNFITTNSKLNKLAKFLDQNGVILKERFKELTKGADSNSAWLMSFIFENTTKVEHEVLDILGKFYSLPTVNLKNKVISPRALTLIPKELAEQHSVVVFKKEQDSVFVATAAPEDKQVIEFIEKSLGFTPEVFLTSPNDIRIALKKYQSEIGEEFTKIIKDSTTEALAVHSTAEKMAEFVPIVKMVNTIIEKAIDQKASDIHIQPTSSEILLRFRVDGILHTVSVLPKEILPSLIARIKLISNLKIDNHRTPEDSRISYNYHQNKIAIRVSVIPTLNGSKVVLRLLDMENNKFTLRKLGLNKRDYTLLKNEIEKPNGMILVTGPTGSGKTTTLYTLLHILNTENLNICTIEDPIEYGIDGVNQTQIDPQAKLTFANGLRSLLRQDPNVLMVGEIRDSETASISVNAAMTGHLVLSTLHTNNAFLAPQRLIEMGLPKYLVASVANILIGQRLVRKICLNCRVKSRVPIKHIENNRRFFDLDNTFARLKELGLLPVEIQKVDDVEIYYGRGCDKCSNTGYQGRLGIYEVIQVDDEVKKAILDSGSEKDIKQAALKRGTLTMTEDGILKVILGKTTFDEISRVTKE